MMKSTEDGWETPDRFNKGEQPAWWAHKPDESRTETQDALARVDPMKEKEANRISLQLGFKREDLRGDPGIRMDMDNDGGGV